MLGEAPTRRQAIAAGLSLLCLAVVPRETVSELRGDGLPDDVIMLAGALPDSELDGYRGGFDVGGFQVNFGALVRTLFEGKELVSQLTFGDRIGNQVRGSISSMLNDLQTGQSVAVGGDQNATVVQAISGSTNVTYDFRNGILTTVGNTANNATVSNTVTMNVGISNYQATLRGAQINYALQAASASIRNASLRR